MNKSAQSFLEWLPLKTRIKCINKLSTRVIEDNFALLGIAFKDIFYIKTWSLEFLETHLQPEHTEFWDHISVYYVLNEAFCERNIAWLNFYELFYSQVLSKKFYLKHSDRIDWVTTKLDRRNIFKTLLE